MRPTVDQRKEQFAVVLGLVQPTEVARLASDDAVNALNAQLSAVDALEKRMNLLAPKVQQWGGGTPAEFVEFYTIKGEHDSIEFPKLEPLRKNAEALYVVFADLQVKLVAAARLLTDDPKAVEQV